MNIELSKKFKLLFEIPQARDKIKKFREGSPKYNKQLEMCNVDTILVTGGRFSAKSFGVGTASCSMAAVHNHRILYTRYTLISAKDSIIPEFNEKIGLLGFEKYFNVTNDRIEGIHNDSKIVFKGIKTSSGNQTANLKSLKDFSCFILDEAEEMPDYDSWEKIALSIRTSDVQNLNILILNPATKEHWIYEKFFQDNGVEAGFNGIKGNICYIHTTYLDVNRKFIPDNIFNKYDQARIHYEKYEALTPDQREQVQKGTQLYIQWKWYGHVVLGGWLDKAEGVIFENWELGDFDTSLPIKYGMDFGFNPDPTTVVAVAVDEMRKIIYAKELLYKTNLSSSAIIDELSGSIRKSDMLICDCADPRMINEIRNAGFNAKACQKGPDSVRNGIKSLLSYQLIVDPNSPNLIKELNNYVYSDKKAGVPEDNWNHCIDPIRYVKSYKPAASIIW